ncbi:hypothetical protein ACFUMI_29935, partial [Streptomyces sp. NPDC057273]|uniref:hypothetical protein n=1 Tax=Streptomyces sp. NPDC057273 TaxID=3346080 RepID=UPI00363EC097
MSVTLLFCAERPVAGLGDIEVPEWAEGPLGGLGGQAWPQLSESALVAESLEWEAVAGFVREL